ncbi:urease accessory protein UreE [Devosia pacifica]|uniref:Urease accessory protein UreE n=1 Tax=Devosia pacifica TaxID=1335967 RepID=A0A918RXA8_9HYPH|nr:urease accessory protein UreE [Devosia pacifica]GHA16098.1 urease accessory protein UreE [Devosia pacifica]
MLRATTFIPPGHDKPAGFDHVVLNHDERRLRRKLLYLAGGGEMIVDLPATTTLPHGSALVLDDGRLVDVRASEEDLLEVRARSDADLVRLAWHIGNRHTPAQLDAERILIAADHVLKTMLEGLGATVTPVRAPFAPEHGAYHAHEHASTNHALARHK